MGHINHVRTVRMTPEQIEAQRARMRRGRQLASQPWYLDHLTPAQVGLALKEDEIPPLRLRFTPAERKAYDNRFNIITRLRKGEPPEVLAREHIVSVHFIRWIDGRSRA